MTAILERVASQRRRRSARLPFHLSDTFDRVAILAALDGLHAAAGPNGVVHFDVVGLFREAMTDARAKIRHDLEEGGDGLRCARHLSNVQDELIRTLFDYVVRHIHPAPERERRRLVVAAVGGYGRGTLAPGSDIDLLFLLFAQTGRRLGRSSVVEAMLYTALGFAAQKVGHSTRSIDECLRLGARRHDHSHHAPRSASDPRRSGRAVRRSCKNRFDDEVVKSSTRTAREFVAAKLAERDARITKREGRSRYLVEPNVKEGKGGLRDLNTFFWIAKYVYRVRRRRSELVQCGPVHQAQEIPVCSTALRRIPMAGALPPAFP